MSDISKAFVLEQLHRAYREDVWLNEIVNSGAVKLDVLAQQIVDLYNSNWFDTLTEEYVERYERELGIKKDPAKTLQERRTMIEAKWKGSTKISVSLIQSLMDAIGEGCTVEFGPDPFETHTGEIITVNGDGFYPGIDERKNAIEEIKPAHIAVEFGSNLRSERNEAHHGGVLHQVWADIPV